MYLQQDIETEIGVTDLKEQLERSKQHVTEYQTMADNLQKALSEQSEVHYLYMIFWWGRVVEIHFLQTIEMLLVFGV